MFGAMHGRGCGPRGWEHIEAMRERGERFAAEWAMNEGRGRHGGGGRGGRGRMFDGGELRLVLLKLIADEPRHGYDLIRRVEELTGGSYAPSAGVVYPTLTLLADMGLIEEQQAEGAKKRFAATAEGRAHLAENAEQVAELFARLEQVGASAKRTDGAPIRRAMANLRHALQERLSRGEFSEDTLHDVAALLDEVAQKIERLR